ncbi:hypothetical protein [Halalkalicoccus salilacus]|uniref:hypothetical protein n=1 Tax=Halalkalicoccus sp. GCM10025704 TaxID=3252662 RepID=UPI003618E700
MTVKDDTTAKAVPYEEPTDLEQLYQRLNETGVTKAFLYGLLGVFLAWTLFPVYWLVTATLKTRETLVTFPLSGFRWTPSSVTSRRCSRNDPSSPTSSSTASS